MDRKLIESLSFYPHLNRDEEELFLRNTRIEHFKQGELVYSPGRECLGMIRVVSGSIRTFMVSEDGRKATIFRLREGEICVLSMSCVLSSVTFDVEVEAAEDTELLIIPAAVFAMVEKKNVYVENFSYHILADRLSDLIEAVQQMMFFSLEQRVASHLLDESSARKSDVLLMTQEEVAENIGSAREAVSRILKKLKEKDLISVERGKISLLDKKGLYGLLS